MPLAKSTVSETDTIVRVSDGNIVAIGGLMKRRRRATAAAACPAPPSAASADCSAAPTRRLVKRELVILLKPTIIQGDRSWDRSCDETRERFEQLNMPDARGYRQ